MPSTSGAQHRAMEVAAHGKSTLGIPKKVGKEFSKADKGHKFNRKGKSVTQHLYPSTEADDG